MWNFEKNPGIEPNHSISQHIIKILSQNRVDWWAEVRGQFNWTVFDSLHQAPILTVQQSTPCEPWLKVREK